MIKDFLAIIFFISMTIVLYILSTKICKKCKSSIMNPVLISSILIMTILVLLKIPYSSYNMGGALISSWLGPIVVVLAIPLYKNRVDLLKNFIPIFGGILAGTITSFISIFALCKLFNIDREIMLSLFSKSITTPMAVESTKILGGNEAITIFAVVLTGIIGAVFAPTILKFGKFKNDIAKGIGIGSSSHALGTSKAVEMGEEIGAASGLAIGVTGLMTIILIIIFS